MLKHVENVNDKEFTERLLTLVRCKCRVPVCWHQPAGGQHMPYKQLRHWHVSSQLHMLVQACVLFVHFRLYPRMLFLAQVEKYLPELRETAAANAAAAAQTAATNPMAAPEPQPAADAAAAVAAIPLGAMPAPEDVQLTIPPVDPLAADSVVVPIPDA
jgi:hypothetical protein